MPCYDTKLEATRDENVVSGGEDGAERGDDIEREVDCVLTTSEFAQLLEDEGVNLRAFASSPFASLTTATTSHDVACAEPPSSNILPAHMLAAMRRADRCAQAGGASGGYAEFVFRRAARELHGIDVEGPVRWTRGRNSDVQELELTDAVSGRALLRVAKVYGFRNIQTLVRKIKRQKKGGNAAGARPYDFVEVMACPGGCLNGGGQMKAKRGGDATAMTTGEMLDAAERSYYSQSLEVVTGVSDDARRIYDDVLRGRCGGISADDALHTSFRARPTNVTLAGVANGW